MTLAKKLKSWIKTWLKNAESNSQFLNRQSEVCWANSKNANRMEIERAEIENAANALANSLL